MNITVRKEHNFRKEKFYDFQTERLFKAVAEALEARELIKLHVLQNCGDDLRGMAEILAERTRSQVVQVIGRKIVLYKEGKDDKKKIVLP